MKVNKIKIILNSLFKKEFAKYLLVGSSSVLIDLATLFVLIDFFKISSVWAVVINQVFIYNYVFFLNKYFVFRVKNNLWKQTFRYYQLAAVNYVFTIVWMYFFVEIGQQHYLLARVLNIILATSWNFFIYRFFVYKKSKT